MHIHKPYDDAFNKDPLGWYKSLKSFIRHGLKKDPGLWLIVGPTGFAMCFAMGMIVNKMMRDPNILLPFPWAQYTDRKAVPLEQMKNTNNHYWPFLRKPGMIDGWENRHTLKKPEDIE